MQRKSSSIGRGIAGLVLALALAAPFAGAAETPTLELARSYMASRPELFRALDISAYNRLVRLTDPEISAAAQSAVHRLSDKADWTPDKPEWQRMQAVVEKDMKALRDRMRDDPHPREVSARLEEAFRAKLVAVLSPEQLQALVDYYGSAPGKAFTATRTQLLDDVSDGVGKARQMAEQGKRPALEAAKADPDEVKQVLSLFDENVWIQQGVMDPGPDGDRSRLKSLPVMMTMGTQMNFDEIEQHWKALPDSARAAILAWRAAPLGQAERQAIMAAAGELHTAVDVPGELRGLSDQMQQLGNKWRAEARP